MNLQDVLKNYEQRKRQREKTVQSLRQDLEKSIEDASIQSLKLQNHVALSSSRKSIKFIKTSKPSKQR
jgi:hypothetical protein